MQTYRRIVLTLLLLAAMLLFSSVACLPPCVSGGEGRSGAIELCIGN